MLSLDRDRGKIRGDRSRAGLRDDEKDPAAESLRDQSPPGEHTAVVRVETSKREYQARDRRLKFWSKEKRRNTLSIGCDKSCDSRPIKFGANLDIARERNNTLREMN